MSEKPDVCSSCNNSMQYRSIGLHEGEKVAWYKCENCKTLKSIPIE